MAPQRNKRAKGKDDDDYDPEFQQKSSGPDLALKLLQATSKQSQSTTKAFQADAQLVLDEVQKELDGAIDAYTARMNALVEAVEASRQELEALPVWDATLLKVMAGTKDSNQDWLNLLKAQSDEYSPDQDGFDTECSEMVERNKLELSKQARKIKKITKAAISEQAETEQSTEQVAREIGRLFKRVVRL